jgi:hypothetical protein
VNPSFNENVVREADGWPSFPVTTSAAAGVRYLPATTNGPELYQCVVCRGPRQPFQAFPRFMGVRVCAECYLLTGAVDSIQRVS